MDRPAFTSRITRSPAESAGGRTPRPPRPAEPQGGRPVRRFDSQELFGPDAEIEIIHHEGVYRLKITRQGKLILNK